MIKSSKTSSIPPRSLTCVLVERLVLGEPPEVFTVENRLGCVPGLFGEVLELLDVGKELFPKLS